jgi:hypothetical protein
MFGKFGFEYRNLKPFLQLKFSDYGNIKRRANFINVDMQREFNKEKERMKNMSTDKNQIANKQERYDPIHVSGLRIRNYPVPLTQEEYDRVTALYSRISEACERIVPKELQTGCPSAHFEYCWVRARHDRRPPNLFDLVSKSALFRATDPRDKVFAFLGLTQPSCPIKPNYSKDYKYSDLMIDVAGCVLQEENKLWILDYVTGIGKSQYGFRFPSWVPESVDNYFIPYHWDRSFVASPPPRKGGIRSRQFRASKGLDADAVISRRTTDTEFDILIVYGLKVDDITAPTGNEDPDKARYTTSSGLTVETEVAAEIGDEVWVIRGALCVYILRRESSTQHSLVGAAALFKGYYMGNLQPSPIMHGSLITSEMEHGLLNRSEMEMLELHII